MQTSFEFLRNESICYENLWFLFICFFSFRHPTYSLLGVFFLLDLFVNFIIVGRESAISHSGKKGPSSPVVIILNSRSSRRNPKTLISPDPTTNIEGSIRNLGP